MPSQITDLFLAKFLPQSQSPIISPAALEFISRFLKKILPFLQRSLSILKDLIHPMYQVEKVKGLIDLFSPGILSFISE